MRLAESTFAVLGATLAMALAIANVRTQGQASNDFPNPYKIENWGQLPAGRKIGAASAIDIDRDGKSVLSTMEFTRLEKHSVPASSFEIPSGYKEQSLAGNMMTPEQQQKMNEQLDKLSPEQRKMVEEMMKKRGGQ